MNHVENTYTQDGFRETKTEAAGGAGRGDLVGCSLGGDDKGGGVSSGGRGDSAAARFHGQRCGRVLVIGLDCADPSMWFGPLAPWTPNLQRLRTMGASGRLEAFFPPITVPSWATMMTGVSPGHLGLYGFRNRVRGGYEVSHDLRHVYLGHADAGGTLAGGLPHKAIWEHASEQGLRVAALCVPPSMEAPPVAGASMACFLCDPEREMAASAVAGLVDDGVRDDGLVACERERAPWAYPADLQSRLTANHGVYMPDVAGFRSRDRMEVLDALLASTRQHFAIAQELWSQEKPDLEVFVEIGTDRLHHLCWDVLASIADASLRDSPREQEERLSRDASSGAFVEASQEGLRAKVLAYVSEVDACLGRWVATLAPEDTVLVVSDHGAQAMRGAVKLNQWLRQRGWLVLRESPSELAPCRADMVDWSATRAWAEGGYYGRVMLNIEGREREGIVRWSEREQVLQALEADLRALGDEIDAEIELLRPENTYAMCRGMPPDLFVTFDQLALRVSNHVGPMQAESKGSDADGPGLEGPVLEGQRAAHPWVQPGSGIGFDQANHATHGLWVAAGAGFASQGQGAGLGVGVGGDGARNEGTTNEVAGPHGARMHEVDDARVQGDAHIQDIAPTVAALLGVQASPHWQGIDVRARLPQVARPSAAPTQQPASVGHVAGRSGGDPSEKSGQAQPVRPDLRGAGLMRKVAGRLTSSLDRASQRVTGDNARTVRSIRSAITATARKVAGR